MNLNFNEKRKWSKNYFSLDELWSGNFKKAPALMMFLGFKFETYVFCASIFFFHYYRMRTCSIQISADTMILLLSVLSIKCSNNKLKANNDRAEMDFTVCQFVRSKILTRLFEIAGHCSSWIYNMNCMCAQSRYTHDL